MQRKMIFLFLAFLPGLLMAQETGRYIPQEFYHEGDTLNYRILYPQGFSEEREYPLMLFLHGAGERGNDNESQLHHGGRLFLKNEQAAQHPAIVVFPQCPKDDFWARIEEGSGSLEFEFPKDAEPTKSLSLVMGLLDDFLEKDYIQKDQVYVGGLSMGGMGAFELLQRKPETFAAAIAICGGGNPDAASAYADNTAVWIFHGAQDEIVSPVHSLRMANALEEAGARVRLSIYENVAHNSWDAAFAEPGLLDWLFSKRLEN